MKSAFLMLVTALSFLLGALSLGFCAMQLLIAERVHETGLFHGIRFEIRQSLTLAGESFLLAVPLSWAGFHFIRRWLKSDPGQSTL